MEFLPVSDMTNGQLKKKIIKLVYFITLTKHYNFGTYRGMKKEEAKKIINVKKRKQIYAKDICIEEKNNEKKYTGKNSDFLPLLSGRSTIMVMIFRTMPEIVKITYKLKLIKIKVNIS